MSNAQVGRTRRVSVIAATVLGLALVGLVGAEAASDDIEPFDVALAKYLGTSPQEAAAIGEAQGRFSDFTTRVWAAYPEQFVRSEWRGDRGVVTVTTGAEQAVKKMAQDALVLIEVEAIDGLGELETNSLAAQFARKLAGVIDGSFATRIDPESGALTVTILGPDSDYLSSELESRIHQAVGSGVDVSVAWEDGAFEDAYDGGERYGSGCTGGFISYRSGSGGVLTAGHCTATPSSYDGQTIGATYRAANDYDLRFRRVASGTPANTIRVAPALTTTITSANELPLGLYVCKWGWATSHTCGTTQSAPGCITTTNGTLMCGGITVTPKTFIEPGDSGGPVYGSHRAYAIASASGTTADLVTPQKYRSHISGSVTIKTS